LLISINLIEFTLEVDA